MGHSLISKCRVIINKQSEQWHSSRSLRTKLTAADTKPSSADDVKARPTTKPVAASFSKTRTSTTPRSTDSSYAEPTDVFSSRLSTPPSPVIESSLLVTLRSSETTVSPLVLPTTLLPTPPVSSPPVVSSPSRRWPTYTKATRTSTVKFSPSVMKPTLRKTDVPSRPISMLVSFAPPLVTVFSAP